MSLQGISYHHYHVTTRYQLPSLSCHYKVSVTIIIMSLQGISCHHYPVTTRYYLPSSTWNIKILAILIISISIIIIIIINKSGRQCKAGKEWSAPYQSKDPSLTRPTNRQKEEKGKTKRQKGIEQLWPIKKHWPCSWNPRVLHHRIQDQQDRSTRTLRGE